MWFCVTTVHFKDSGRSFASIGCADPPAKAMIHLVKQSPCQNVKIPCIYPSCHEEDRAHTKQEGCARVVCAAQVGGGGAQPPAGLRGRLPSAVFVLESES